jgi:hypothetical protein
VCLGIFCCTISVFCSWIIYWRYLIIITKIITNIVELFNNVTRDWTPFNTWLLPPRPTVSFHIYILFLHFFYHLQFLILPRLIFRLRLIIFKYFPIVFRWRCVKCIMSVLSTALYRIFPNHHRVILITKLFLIEFMSLFVLSRLLIMLKCFC